MSVETFEVGGRSVPLILRVSPLAKTMSLRVDPKTDGVVVVLPRGAAKREAKRFVAAHGAWILEHLDKLPGRVAFADGTEIPFQGRPHVIRHRPDAARGVWVKDGEIHVSGRAEHLPRRLTDWLKREARTRIAPLARDFAGQLDRKMGKVSLRDTRSRWGSCSGRGDLSFSWRLILAPEEVLTYVVAHEVAHLVELNHSPAYWAVVERLVDNRRQARAWLKENGLRLHRYG